MSTDKRQFTMRMQQYNFEKIRIISMRNKRSIAMQIEYLLENYIADYEKRNGKINVLSDDESRNVVNNNLGGTNFVAIGGNNYNNVATWFFFVNI